MTRLGFALLLQRRIARRDLPLLVVTALLTAVALVCALGAPLLLDRTLDRAVQQAVASAGSSADVLVQSKVGEQVDGGAVVLLEPGQVVAQAEKLRPVLPAVLRRVVSPATAAVVGPQLRIGVDDAAPELRNGPVGLRIALLTRPDAVRIRSGTPPSPTSSSPAGTVDVVLSQAAAQAASLRVGSIVDVPREDGLVDGATLRIRVTGIVDRRAVAGPSPWTDDGTVWSATRNESDAGPSIGITVLTDVAGLTRATAALGPFAASLRLHVDASRLRAAETPAVATAVTEVRTHPDDLAAGSGDDFTVQSSLPEAVTQAEHQAASTRARTALLTAGVLGTAAVAIVLLGGLLAVRRRDPIALLRARGTSVPGVALPALAESAILLVLASAVAVAVTGSTGSPGALAIAVVALVAAPVQIALAAGGGAVHRSPANRSDRARLLRLRRTRRIVLEAGLVLVAVVAVLVLRAGDGLGADDPLLVVAPLLAAAALTVLLVRILPPLIAVAARLARRSRGVAGVLVATSASGARIALPLLALGIAFGLALNDGILVATVAQGQEAASWERVGADARARTDLRASRFVTAPGVRHASAVAELPGVSANLATSGATITLLGVDAGYPALVGSLPGTAPGTAAALRRLTDVPSGALPVVVDADLARSMADRSLQLQIDSKIIPARAVGTIVAGPDGYLDGPFVLVDLDALRRRVPDVRTDTVLLVGPGAATALRRAGVPAADVLTRSTWLATQRAAPLVSGTRRATLLAALLLGLFAVAALSAAVLAGAPERRRVLSLLRTLGMRRRTGWWLLIGDLLPLAVGGLVGGTAIGVIAAELFDPALALAALTGGTTDPPVTISGAVLAAVVGGTVVVLALAVGAEAVTWRRDRVAEVLRVGGHGS